MLLMGRDIRAFLFDFDGVLMPADLVAKAMVRALKDFGIQVDERFVINNIYGHRFVDVGPKLFGLSLDDIVRIRERYHEIYIDLAVKTRPLPGSLEIFSFCKKNGIKTGIISTKMRKETDPVLKALGMKPDVTVFQEDVNKVKPDPEPVITACKKLGVMPRGALLVGDHWSDMRSAKSAGSLAIGVLTGVSGRKELVNSGADMVFPSLLDFLEWLKAR